MPLFSRTVVVTSAVGISAYMCFLEYLKRRFRAVCELELAEIRKQCGK
ncbi:unnamed protein product [Rhodiola kirilowii]